MTRTIDIEETLISQNGQGISIGHMITTIVVDKVTSLRPVQLPSSVRCNDGTPALIQGTAISIGGDQILVAKTINDVKGLLGFNEFNAENEKVDKFFGWFFIIVFVFVAVVLIYKAYEYV